MGTRADFYVGRETMEWIGSLAWDGYPEGIPKSILRAKTAKQFRDAVAAELNGRDDRSLPEDGWPWPWETSSTTDCAYAFDAKKVHLSWFGSPWVDPLSKLDDNDKRKPTGGTPNFPDMSSYKRRPLFGRHSGVIVIGTKP